MYILTLNELGITSCLSSPKTKINKLQNNEYIVNIYIIYLYIYNSIICILFSL